MERNEIIAQQGLGNSNDNSSVRIHVTEFYKNYFGTTPKIEARIVSGDYIQVSVSVTYKGVETAQKYWQMDKATKEDLEFLKQEHTISDVILSWGATTVIDEETGEKKTVEASTPKWKALVVDGKEFMLNGGYRAFGDGPVAE